MTKSIIDNNPQPVIAVDFDATLCDSKYPECGPMMPGARDALIRFHKLGYLILIDSCRTCSWHCEAYGVDRNTPVMERPHVVAMRDWLIANDIPFDEINDGSRGKPWVAFQIDDKGVRFQNNWDEIADFVMVNGPLRSNE